MTWTHNKQLNQSGFTIVELLVVIVVIGILASITIVSYSGIQRGAKIASMQSDLNNSFKQIKTQQVLDNSGNYPSANNCDSSPPANTVCLKSSPGNGYIYTVNNVSNPKTFVLDIINGNLQYRITDNSAPLAVTGATTQGPLYPAVAANNSTVGTFDWVENWAGSGYTLTQAINADAGGGLFPSGVRISGLVTDTSAKLFIGGVASGTSQHLGTGFSTGIRTYGSSSNLWGMSITAAQVNAGNFGFGISITGNGGTSRYLYVSNFGFNLPEDVTINGIEVICDVQNPAGNPNFDYIQMKVYYTI